MSYILSGLDYYIKNKRQKIECVDVYSLEGFIHKTLESEKSDLKGVLFKLTSYSKNF